MTRAPGGTSISEPTAAMRPSRTTITSGPVMRPATVSISCPARMAIAGPSARTALRKPVARSASAHNTDLIFISAALAVGSPSALGPVQGHGGANERLQRLLVYRLALAEVDGTPRVPLETRVEEARRILQSRPLGEGHLHDVLVGLTGADQSLVRPHWHASPFPLLDDFRIGFLDQGTEPAEHLAPPVAQLLDSRVYQLRRRLGFLRAALLHGPLL